MFPNVLHPESFHSCCVRASPGEVSTALVLCSDVSVLTTKHTQITDEHPPHSATQQNMQCLPSLMYMFVYEFLVFLLDTVVPGESLGVYSEP